MNQHLIASRLITVPQSVGTSRCSVEHGEAPMNKTQSGGSNRTRWKAFTRIVHRNVTQNDELDERGWSEAFFLL